MSLLPESLSWDWHWGLAEGMLHVRRYPQALEEAPRFPSPPKRRVFLLGWARPG